MYKSLENDNFCLFFNELCPKISEMPDESSELTPHFHRMLGYHKLMDENLPAESVVFIGDSIVQGLATTAIVANSVNFGIGSDTSYGVLKRMPHYQCIKRAKAVVLAIGINDVLIRSAEEYIGYLKEIITFIPERVPVLVSAILPNDVKKIPHDTQRNDKVNVFNDALRQYLDGVQQVSYLDCGHKFEDEDGDLKNDYHTGDGVHLNAEGYRIWIRELKGMMDAMLAG